MIHKNPHYEISRRIAVELGLNTHKTSATVIHFFAFCRIKAFKNYLPIKIHGFGAFVLNRRGHILRKKVDIANNLVDKKRLKQYAYRHKK